MNEKDEMTDLIRASLDGIRDVASSSTVIGNAILTPSGVTVIPVSRVSCGFLTGGVDLYPKKSDKPQNFGGGGGSGVQVTPTAFLTIGPDARVDLIRLDGKESPVNRIGDLVEELPDLLARIKGIFS